jgi:hypothetical protein
MVLDGIENEWPSHPRTLDGHTQLLTHAILILVELSTGFRVVCTPRTKKPLATLNPHRNGGPPRWVGDGRDGQVQVQDAVYHVVAMEADAVGPATAPAGDSTHRGVLSSQWRPTRLGRRQRCPRLVHRALHPVAIDKRTLEAGFKQRPLTLPRHTRTAPCRWRDGSDGVRAARSRSWMIVPSDSTRVLWIGSSDEARGEPRTSLDSARCLRSR